MTPRNVCRAAAVLLLGASSLWAQQPPRDLHQVGDHWTAWEPPATPPEGAEVHVVERGDTLWSLAERFYGNPYLWPQLWERNQWVLDAHWIYPGDPLVVNVGVTPAETLSVSELGDGTSLDGDDMDTGMGGESPATDGLATEMRPPVPLGSESDIYCSGYVGDEDEVLPYRIIGSEYEGLSPRLEWNRGGVEGLYGRSDTIKVNLSLGDIVYLDGGRRAGLSIGSQYSVVEPGVEIRHPATKNVIGRLHRYLGRVRVLSAQEERAIAEITHSCEPIRVGAALKQFEPEPVPLGRRAEMRPPASPPSEREGAPMIIAAKDGAITLGADHVVFIDRGEDADVAPGDIYTIYRPSASGAPPVVLGELAVLSVQARASVARIIESRYSIYVGDRLEIK